MVSQTARSAVATVAWLATDHQQLMYLLSPEGKTVFYIPGVEVVHKVSTPINLPEESNKVSVSAFTGVHRLCPAHRSLPLTLGLGPLRQQHCCTPLLPGRARVSNQLNSSDSAKPPL